MTTIITMYGGPLDGQEYEVTSIGSMGGYITVPLTNLINILRNYDQLTQEEREGDIKTAQVPIKMNGNGKYYAKWDEREHG